MSQRVAIFVFHAAVAASTLCSSISAFSLHVSNLPIRSKYGLHVCDKHNRHRMTEDDVSDDANTRLHNEDAVKADSEQANEEENKASKEILDLKDEIAELESEIRRKKGQLTNTKRMSEKYSQAGYMRQVALVENDKRRRGDNMADSKYEARAIVLQSFLPVLEELDAVGLKYEGGSFASSLDALRTGFKTSLQELGVAEYTAEIGEDAEAERVIAVEEKFSNDFPKGTIVASLKSGLEIRGNVIRPAECAISLGSEEQLPTETVEDESIDTSDEGNKEEDGHNKE